MTSGLFFCAISRVRKRQRQVYMQACTLSLSVYDSAYRAYLLSHPNMYSTEGMVGVT